MIIIHIEDRPIRIQFKIRFHCILNGILIWVLNLAEKQFGFSRCSIVHINLVMIIIVAI
uniref:pro-sigmaK processing inhibitor BofA family protein n=1 Tax=Peribacillus tepidiphilus TaxID=2652445 RepID=UPI0035B51483